MFILAFSFCFCNLSNKSSQFFITIMILLFYREEIEKLAKENELYEEDIVSAKVKLKEQSKEKEKVERVLADAAEALKTALQVN